MTPAKGPNKRAKGEGSVYRVPADETLPLKFWAATVPVPSHDGRRRRITRKAQTEAQAGEKLKVLRRELLKNGDLPTAGQTLTTWMRTWFRDIALKNVRPKTAAVYRTMMEQYIIPAIGKVRLDKLTPEHVRRLEQYVLDKGLSPTTAFQAHRVLAVALKYAHRENRVTRNVATLTDAPRKARRELGVLTAADGVKVLLMAADDPYGARWAVALLTGARQGEVLGLTWDRVTDELDLSWQLQRYTWEHGCTGCGRKRGAECPNRKVTFPADHETRYLTGGLWLSRPKSNAGWRIIPLVEPLKSILARHKQKAPANEFNLVWSDEGRPIDPSADNRAWHRLLKAVGVPDVRLHDARHTAASLLLEAGVSEPIAMKILGHSSYVVTRAYQHVDRKQLAAAMEALASRLPLER